MARVAVAGKKSNGMQQPEIDWNEIAQVAYELFEQRGFVHGHDQEDWLRAEQIVRQRLFSNRLTR